MKTVAICDWDGRIDSIAEEAKVLGFDRAVLCVEDRHVLYRQDNAHEAISALQNEGIEVLLDPWGISGFAGETVSRNLSMPEWAVFARSTEAEGILLDEPKGSNVVLENMISIFKSTIPDKKLVLAIEPERNPARWQDMVDEVSVSTYLFGKKMENTTWHGLRSKVEKWSRVVPEGGTAWVQAWGIPAGKEWVPVCLIKCWKELGIDTNIWAWEAFKTVSSKRPAHPDTVWQNIRTNI